MNKHQALAAVAEMESLIEGFGAPNQDALRIVNRHVVALQGHDGYLNEKLGSLESWAKIGFSTRKYQPWGLDQVKHFALSDLMMVHRLVNEWPDSP